MRGIFALILVIFCFSCSQSPIKTGIEADHNRYNLTFLQVGMSEEQVMNIMGYPYNTETLELRGDHYDIWYYITKSTDLGQTKMLPRNFTPLVFKNGYLAGFGYHYLKHLREDEKQQRKYDYHEKNRYTDEDEEWPKNRHGYVPPPPYDDQHQEYYEEPKSKDQHPYPEKPRPTYEDENQTAPMKQKPKSKYAREPKKVLRKEKAPPEGCPEREHPDDKTYWWD